SGAAPGCGLARGPPRPANPRAANPGRLTPAELQLALHAAPERRLGSRSIFQTPVLLVDAAVLGLIEPHETQGPVPAHPAEQAADLARLARVGTYRGLGQKHRLARERSHFTDRVPENAGERVGQPVEV